MYAITVEIHKQLNCLLESVTLEFLTDKNIKMNTTELLKDALDWADKRLKLLDEPITETQRHYIEFALRQNLVKNIGVTHCCKSDSEQLFCGICDEETKHDTSNRKELHCLKCDNVAKE